MAAHRAISGTTLIDSASEMSTATERLIESARKNWPGTPDSRPSGANTTTVVSVELTSGAINCGHRVDDAAPAFAGAAVNVLDHDHRIVDDQADRDGQAAHRHQVDRPAEQPHEDEGRDDRHRQRHRGDHRQAPVAEEDEEHDDGEEAADQDGVAHAHDRLFDELRQVVDAAHLDAGRKRLREAGERRVQARLEVEDVGADLLGDVHHDRVASVAGDEQRAIGRAGRHGAEIRHAKRRAVLDLHRRVGDFVRVLPEPGRQRQVLLARFREAPDREESCSA